ncbi:MAG: molybdate ABC transporter substrate-binding protein [Campylobacteraceae bacterium]|nr:molybdate ABC transporter substrate-binding protein [Campylobacteraceae bacterium]
MKKWLGVLSLVLGISLQAGTINLAVAANVTYAMDELVAKFNETNPNTKIETTLSSSGKLVAQIKNGAPYVILMAANMAYPEAMYKEGFAVTEPKIYARGALAFLSAKTHNYAEGLSLLAKDNIRKVAIANPKTAPYGTAAVEAMKKSNLYEAIEPKLVYAESISQTVTYSVTAADIGIVNASALYSSKMTDYKRGVHWEMVDKSLYTPIDQGIVLLKKGEESAEARAFYDFMLSEDARKIMERYGYLLP